MSDHRDNQAKFLERVEGWANKLDLTKKDLYRHIGLLYARPYNWVESRQRGAVHASKEDIDWMIWAEENDTTPSASRPVQYVCYECEESYPGLPFYTMIPAGVEPGAYMCHVCFRGLEAEGHIPDDPNDPRQLLG
jgi:hypothetical protein